MDVREPRRLTRREMAMLPPTAAMEPASLLRAVFACRWASCTWGHTQHRQPGLLCDCTVAWCSDRAQHTV